jgi:hypothetical protein
MSFNFSVKRGDTLPIDIAVTLAGATYDLTLCTLYFSLRRLASGPDSAVLVAKETGNGIVHTDIPGGLAHLVLSAEETSALPTSVALAAEIRLKTSSAELYTIETGQLALT